MAVSADVLQIVQILEEEGFGSVAGELLTEISLGREVDLDDSDRTHSEKPSSDDDFDVEEHPRRVPIPDDEQLREAIRFLRYRLVEPVRRLAEVERIAAQLIHDTEQTADQGKEGGAIRVKFVNPHGEPVTGFTRGEPEGEHRSAERLDKVLVRIIEQPAD